MMQPSMSHIIDSRTVLAVRDLRASTAFFVDALGFTRDFGDGSDGWSFLSRGAFKLMLGECADERPATDIGDHAYVAYLIVDDIDGLHAELQRRSVSMLNVPTDEAWGFREFGLKTPDGHRIRFGQPLGAGS